MAKKYSQPVYCKDCNSHNSWIRNPVRDIHGVDSGRVLWWNYKCKVCGRTTIIPAELDYKDISAVMQEEHHVEETTKQ